MIFQQLLNEESGCLSYLIGCAQAGRAVVVDPGRDRVHDYIRIARKKGLTITDVVETHTHADHISGNRDLAAVTKAAIHVHRAAGVMFPHETLADGDSLRLGNVELRACHPPGHTPAFRFASKARFVDFIMEGTPPTPAAFETIVAKNRGLLPLTAAKPRPMSAREAWEAAQAGAVILDLRDPGTHGETHPAGALNVWIDGPQFPERVAGFVPPGTRVIVLAQAPSDVDRAVQALSRVGVDDVIGYLQWGMIDWRDAALPVETVPQISAWDLHTLLESGEAVVVDVREPFEWLEGHVQGAMHLPMFEAVARAAELPADRPKAVVCAGGLRSSTTISALKRRVPGPWFNVTGGMGAWLKAGYGVTRAQRLMAYALRARWDALVGRAWQVSGAALVIPTSTVCLFAFE